MDGTQLWSRRDGNTGDLGPGPERLSPGGAIPGGEEAMATEVEEVVDLVVGGEETLGLSGRLEPLHLAFASSGGLMGDAMGRAARWSTIVAEPSRWRPPCQCRTTRVDAASSSSPRAR
jgi:hypothetical protein